MMSTHLCRTLATGLIPLLFNQACSSHDPTYAAFDSGELRLGSVEAALTSAETSEDVPAFEVTTLAGFVNDVNVEGDWLGTLLQQRPGVAPYLAGGQLTESPLALLDAPYSRLKGPDGQLVRVVRGERSLHSPDTGRRVSWNESMRTIAFGAGESQGAITLPQQLTAAQARFILSGLAYHWLNETAGEAEAEEAWGPIIVILLILIGAVALLFAAGEACCDSERKACELKHGGDMSFSCTPSQGGSASVGLEGVSIELPTFCAAECSSGSSGPGLPPEETETM